MDYKKAYADLLIEVDTWISLDTVPSEKVTAYTCIMDHIMQRYTQTDSALEEADSADPLDEPRTGHTVSTDEPYTGRRVCDREDRINGVLTRCRKRARFHLVICRKHSKTTMLRCAEHAGELR